MHKKLLLCLVVLFSSSRHAGAAEGPTRSQSNLPSAYTEIGIGTSQVNQTLNSTNVERPPAGRISVQGRFADFIHFGVAVLGAYHTDTSSPATYSQIDNIESVVMYTVNAGVMIGKYLILDAGYGMATMSRLSNSPFASPASSQSYNASGTGWTLGGAILPVRLENVAIGVSGYYFEATSTALNSKITSAGTDTYASVPAHVRSFGYYAGLALVFHL